MMNNDGKEYHLHVFMLDLKMAMILWKSKTRKY